MEFSQDGGGSEECSSSESGWTMYLASPMHDDDDDGDGEVEDGAGEDHGRITSSNSDEYNEEDGGGGDDDSLASDASSGPASHRGHGKSSSTKVEIKEKGVGRKNHKAEANCKGGERNGARGSTKEQGAVTASCHGNSKGRKAKTDKK